MNDPAFDKIRNLLPELYPSPDGRPEPGQMCTPESGCAPAANRSYADMLNVGTGKSGPPAQAEPVDQIADPDDHFNIADLLFPQKPKP
jgi:hypothetical protein